jgi:hypothetical protein
VRQVGGFLRVLRFPPPNKLTPTIYYGNIVESGVEYHNISSSLAKGYDQSSTFLKEGMWIAE